MKYVIVSLATGMYAVIWVTCLFILIGFLMPNPARFARAISGLNRKKRHRTTPVKSDLEKDDYLFYEIIDD